MQQQQQSIAVDNNDLVNRIISLPDEEFWKLVSVRLNIPLSGKNQIKDPGIAEDKREYWTEDFLIEDIFLQIAGTKEIIRHGNKQIRIYKYYSQALRLRKWIPIAKPTPEFVIDVPDLTVRIVSELKALDEDGAQYVLKQAVGQIFENIDSRQYHLSIARKLKVILQS